MYAKWITSIEVLYLGTGLNNEMTCYQVRREGTSINLTTLVNWAPLHKTMVTLQLMISLQSMVTIIEFLTLIGYGEVLLW